MSDDEPTLFSLGFEEPGAAYVSGSQRARIFTKSWVATRLFCPNCGARRITQHVANQPVADFHCAECREEFELKSQRGRLKGRPPRTPSAPRIGDTRWTSTTIGSTTPCSR